MCFHIKRKQGILGILGGFMSFTCQHKNLASCGDNYFSPKVEWEEWELEFIFMLGN